MTVGSVDALVSTPFVPQFDDHALHVRRQFVKLCLNHIGSELRVGEDIVQDILTGGNDCTSLQSVGELVDAAERLLFGGGP